MSPKAFWLTNPLMTEALKKSKNQELRRTGYYRYRLPTDSSLGI
jgi:hypothetical protein